MLKQICLLAFLALAVSAQMGSGPPAIRNFYDTIFILGVISTQKFL